jgi:hypothetical protein
VIIKAIQVWCIKIRPHEKQESYVPAATVGKQLEKTIKMALGFDAWEVPNSEFPWIFDCIPSNLIRFSQSVTAVGAEWTVTIIQSVLTSIYNHFQEENFGL